MNRFPKIRFCSPPISGVLILAAFLLHSVVAAESLSVHPLPVPVLVSPPDLGPLAYGFLNQLRTIGIRRAGLEGEIRAGRWLADQFKATGLQPVVESISYPAYRPQETLLIVEGHEEAGFPSVFTAFGTGSTGPQGIHGELAYIKTGIKMTPEDSIAFMRARREKAGGFEKGKEFGNASEIRDVAGTIPVVDIVRLANYLDLNGKVSYHAVSRQGALACILIDNKPYNSVSPHSLKMGDPDKLADLPCVILGYEDGKRLKEFMKAGATRATVISRVQTVPWSSENIYAIIPGKSNKVVLITSPHDAFWEGASDSGAGLAGLAALSGYYSRMYKSEPPPLTLVFLSTTGHYAAGGIGVNTFIKKHKEWINDDFLVNVHLGNCIAGSEVIWTAGKTIATGRENTRWAFISKNPFLSAISHQAVWAAGLSGSLIPTPAGAFNIGEHTSFAAAAGVRHIAVMGAPSYSDSAADTYDKLTENMMKRILTFYVSAIDQILATPIDRMQYEYEPDPEYLNEMLRVRLANKYIAPEALPAVTFCPLEQSGRVRFEAAEMQKAAVYIWDFGDGSVIMPTKIPIIEHQYQKPGDYAISLIAVDPGGNSIKSETRLRID